MDAAAGTYAHSSAYYVEPARVIAQHPSWYGEVSVAVYFYESVCSSDLSFTSLFPHPLPVPPLEGEGMIISTKFPEEPDILF